MSWLYSQALVEASSVDTSSDGAPYAPLSVISTPHQFSHRDKMTDISRLSRYGLTYAVLTADHGEDVLMSFLAGFPVKTSQPLGEEQASQDPDQASGMRWSELFARWSPDSSSWKTLQCSLLEGLGSYSETWPRWGSMRSGVCWERTTSEHHTKEIGSGFWPTPVKDDTGIRRSKYAQGGTPLSLAIQTWPTPTKSDYAARRKTDKWQGGDLVSTVTEKEENQGRPQPRAGGKLNPMWVEWLMAWPMGWTDSEPLGMDRFQEWRRLHLTSYTTD